MWIACSRHLPVLLIPGYLGSAQTGRTNANPTCPCRSSQLLAAPAGPDQPVRSSVYGTFYRPAAAGSGAAAAGGAVQGGLAGCYFRHGPAGPATAPGRARRPRCGGAAVARGPPAASAHSGSLTEDEEQLRLRDALLSAWPPGKPRAAIVVLARNSDLPGLVNSMHQLEQRFNGRPQARYPYVFLNDGNFTEAFRAGVQQATPAPCLFGRILREHWSYPPFIDQVGCAAGLLCRGLALMRGPTGDIV